MPSVFVSIINYNGNEDTNNCLKSLDELESSGFKLEVIIVDNASKIKFVQKEEFKNFTPSIINSDKNLGFSGGHNLAINEALNRQADYVVILNNDVLVDKKLILELVKTFEKNPDCGIVSPKIYFAKGHEFHRERYKEDEKGKVIWYAGGKMDWNNVLASHVGVDEVDKGQFDKVMETDFASGCCMMVRRKVFETVGKFDENYFLYYEDNDLSQRAKKAGFKLYFQPNAVVWHINAGSVGGSGSKMQDYYITRNRIYFANKYASFRARIAVFRESLKFLVFGRASQRIGVRDYFLRNFGKGSFK